MTFLYLTFRNIPDTFGSYFVKKLASVICRPKLIHIIHSQESRGIALAVAGYNVSPQKAASAEDLCIFLERNNALGIKINTGHRSRSVAAQERLLAWNRNAIQGRLKELKIEYKKAFTTENAANRLIGSFLDLCRKEDK